MKIGAGKTIINAMSSQKDNAKVQYEGCYALGNLGENCDSQALLMKIIVDQKLTITLKKIIRKSIGYYQVFFECMNFLFIILAFEIYKSFFSITYFILLVIWMLFLSCRGFNQIQSQQIKSCDSKKMAITDQHL